LIVDLELPHDWKIGEISISTFSLSNGDGITLESQGKLIQSELQRFALRWYGIEEFKLILESIGFSQITCSADYVYKKRPSDAGQIITFEAVRKVYVDRLLSIWRFQLKQWR